MDVPDTVAGAELLEAELFAHTRSPEDTAGYLHCLATQLATARATYRDARDRDADGEALAAADEWFHLTQMIGVIMDEMRAMARGAVERDRRGATVVLAEYPRPDNA